MKNKLLFPVFLSVVAWNAFFALPVSAADSTENPAHILAYGIEKRKFEELVPGATNQLRWVEKCVFFPIVDNRIKDSVYRRNTQSAAEAIVRSLQARKGYYVVKDGNPLTPRFGSFHVSATDLPAYFASPQCSDICP